MIRAPEAFRGGRPALRYALNPDCYSLLCFYAEGNDSSARIVRALFSATGGRRSEDRGDVQQQQPEAFYASVTLALKRWPNIRAIGAGVSGGVADGTVLSNDISSFSGLKIAQTLSQQTGVSCSRG
ncbi:hypothetical protein SAMN05216516_10739 [Izhakiella capsodis]|uniref:Uncharacterized protein n=1 Tax=Izhakiella capsodis TaxID=1367852 RepID=A0A1I4YUP3_9GAMM|nr:hypothetical protein [Izhakiella capsodis]SFN41483.1 hypothetical protein SAMN05216516_10739 [Izhakiella capsodis]